MPKIKSPGSKFPSDQVIGPNFVESVDPQFGSAWRNPSGDVGSTLDYVGKEKTKPEPGVLGLTVLQKRK